MLYVFIGSDTVRAKHEVRTRAKKTPVILVGEGGESFESVPTLLTSRGLFSEELVLMLDRPLESAEGRQLLQEHDALLQKSDAMVFAVAGDISATEKKLFPKGVTFESFDIKTAPPTRPNVFAFSDTFLSGDRKKSWIGYRILLREGISAEEIHGVLLWAVRSTLLAAKTENATEAGLKPFVFSKSKRVAEKRGVPSIENLSRNLVRAYHEARSGKGTLELNLEALILEK